MKKYATAFLRKVSVFLEMFISLMLAVGITLLAIKLAFSLRNIPYLDIYPNYEDLLETCFNLIIGVELIRMLYQHRPSTVFEVLLFAIARQIIIDHANPLNSLIGVIAIAILFATRKFLFSEFEESEKVIFRATSKVRHVNSIIHVHIPYHDEQTLLDVLKERFAQEKTDVGVGACTYYDNFGLRVAKMHNGEISRVEVIRSIH
ncbi:transporter [Bariatricus massiliensis]|uniref:Transporter n=1 Tax=Bariatricus massiliensis TaxID=1745713 RepID=A0ABS8DIZ7_9FIRM|nr:transporter [Bariatricus massiliensis]MCB7305267.1 transporter [Bariatricus massiliensis]MCB7375840.1 transporter [Bariatricus massiliensis]MCB7388410.1 transporter [Bariatricus massiliensis]MCB7412602.1 transporter [Bariatricus massiliensis]MCQ5254760.1 transporter [Bariatricus massiliensis]